MYYHLNHDARGLSLAYRHTHARTHMPTHTHGYTHMFTDAHTYMCTCAHMNTHVQIPGHTYVHAHIQTHVKLYKFHHQQNVGKDACLHLKFKPWMVWFCYYSIARHVTQRRPVFVLYRLPTDGIRSSHSVEGFTQTILTQM